MSAGLPAFLCMRASPLTKTSRTARVGDGEIYSRDVQEGTVRVEVRFNRATDVVLCGIGRVHSLTGVDGCNYPVVLQHHEARRHSSEKNMM